MTANNAFAGQRVRLRAIEPEDGTAHFQWDQDSEVSRVLDYVWFPHSAAASKKWAEQEALKEPDGDNVVLAIETLDGVRVGMISAHHCDRRTGTLMYGIGVHPQHQRRGYAREAIWLLLRHFFQELRYQKVTVDVYDFNEASIKLHESLGFTQEGRLRRMGFTHGRHFDVLKYGMTVEEFRALHLA